MKRSPQAASRRSRGERRRRRGNEKTVIPARPSRLLVPDLLEVRLHGRDLVVHVQALRGVPAGGIRVDRLNRLVVGVLTGRGERQRRLEVGTSAWSMPS